MPRLCFLGIDPTGTSVFSEAARTCLREPALVLAGNPQHPLLNQHFAKRVQAAAAARVRTAIAGETDVVYAAVGHPLLDDGSARALHQQARAAGWDVHAIPAPSLLEQAYVSLGIGVGPHQVVSGVSHSLGRAETALVVVSANVPRRALRQLVREYPSTHEVRVLARNSEQVLEARTMSLRDAMAQHPDVLLVPPLKALERLDEPDSLRWIMARLRAPDGCPWDREQTHQSLKRHLLEETAEVVDALDEENMVALREELGDLLLQVYFQAQVAEEQGDFSLDDVVRGISEKLVRRHPHVFGDRAADSADQALANWESIKQEEHAEQGKERLSLLDGVPLSLSGLATAQAIGKAVAKVGFDWPNYRDVIAKLREEMEELESAETPEHRFEELGDVLFVMAQVAKWLDVDAEEALRASNSKFRRRFAYMEEVARVAGSELGDYSFEKLDSLWEEAKLATSSSWGCPR